MLTAQVELIEVLWRKWYIYSGVGGSDNSMVWQVLTQALEYDCPEAADILLVWGQFIDMDSLQYQHG